MDKIPFDTIEEYLDNKDTFKNPAFTERAFKKAQEKLVIDEIDMKDFVESRDVPKDEEYVQKLEKIFEQEDSPQEKENKKLATIEEAILHIQIEQNCYLGDDVKAFSACKLDDIKNGVDEILEIKYDDGKNVRHIAIAVDATFSVNAREKVENIKEGIKRGKLAVVEYLKFDVSDTEIEKKELPKFILGIDKKNLEDITRLWMKDKNKKLYYHPLHIMVLNEILQQAKYYQDCAEEAGQMEISEKYKELYDIFLQVREELIKEILKNPENEEKMEEDMVYQSIIQL